MADVVDVLQEFCPGEKVTLIGQSMGAHAAFLVAHARPDLMNQLIMLEGHVAGGKEPEDSQAIGALLHRFACDNRVDLVSLGLLSSDSG